MKITENTNYVVKDRANHERGQPYQRARSPPTPRGSLLCLQPDHETREQMNPAIREELDQTPAWWDRQYRTLVQKQTPRSATFHEDHEMAEERTYADLRVRRWCLECGVSIDDYEEN